MRPTSEGIGKRRVIFVCGNNRSCLPAQRNDNDGCRHMLPLPPLRHPIYFVSKELHRFQDLIDSGGLSANFDEAFKRCVSGADVWSVQTYILLKLRGLDVRLTDCYVPETICVVPHNYLLIRDRPYKSFVVACRTDSPRPAICEMQSVMNSLAIKGPQDHYLPHWPQPIMIPRDKSRGTRVENLDFKGHPRNLTSSFKSAEFVTALHKIGMDFLFNRDAAQLNSDPRSQYLSWADYSKSDVVLAVRNLTEYDFGLKPAVKLVNAWLAGVPALLGPEPAYQALRKSELDYLEVSTADDALRELRRLQTDPLLYQRMVENGLQRFEECSADVVAHAWYRFLHGPVTTSYEAWREQGTFSRLVGRPLRFVLRARQHKKNVSEHAYLRDHGYRPVPD